MNDQNEAKRMSHQQLTTDCDFIIAFLSAVVDGVTVALTIGLGRGPQDAGFVGMKLDKLAELHVDGKVVASIDASILTPEQQAALKKVLVQAFAPAHWPPLTSPVASPSS